MCELDKGRAPDKRMFAPKTVRLLASNFAQFNNWFLVFSEFPDLTDESATRFVNVGDSIDKISNETLRGNTLGALQANIGLWQILARQGQIPTAQLNSSWQKDDRSLCQNHLVDAALRRSTRLIGSALGSSRPRRTARQSISSNSSQAPRQDAPDGPGAFTRSLPGEFVSVLEDQQPGLARDALRT